MSGPAPPGYFGKIPARGDFLARRVPPSVAAAWEHWLQELAATVREIGERGWQDAWLTAPLWHFVLGRNLAGPHGAAGLLVASADRVGRLFPFTIIGAAAPDAAPDRAEWGRHAEGLAVAALDESFDPATLDASLATLGPPPAPNGPNRPAGVWPLVLDGDWPEPGDPLATDAAAQPGPGPDQSEWWCRGSDRILPIRLRCTGLPGRRTAGAMVLGGAEMQPRPEPMPQGP